MSEINFSGVSLNESQQQTTARSTESTAAFRSRKAKLIGLGNVCLGSAMCSKVSICSIQLDGEKPVKNI